jgi:hypothetical protein
MALQDHTQLFQREGLHHHQSPVRSHNITCSLAENYAEFPCIVAAFVVNSEPHIGAVGGAIDLEIIF